MVGENRAQDLEAKHAVYGDAFRWHFIGRLQSNKVKVVNRTCELVHSLDSQSAAERLEIPALVQVNLAGEGSKGGVDPGDGRATIPRRRVPRPLGDAARRRRPGGRRASGSAGCGELAQPSTASRSSRWGRRRTTASPPRRARRTCASAASCSASRRLRPVATVTIHDA